MDRSDSASGGPLTPRRVPEAFIRAEIESFPLTAVQALRSGLVELDPTLEKEAPGRGPPNPRTPTQKLWRACEDTLVQHASGWSLDRLIAVRDQAWFGKRVEGERPQSVPMHRYLRELAREHLMEMPGVTEVRRPSNTEELNTLRHYRWLSFAMPEDLLVAAVDVEPPPQWVALEQNVLLVRRLIDRGVAEIHQHVSAGLDFPLLWAGALAALADPVLPADIMVGPGTPIDGREMLRWLLVAALARMVLAEFLLRRDLPRGQDAFHQYVISVCRPRRHRAHDGGTLNQAIKALALHAGYRLPEFEALQTLYGNWHPALARIKQQPLTSVADVWRFCDPLAVRLGISKRSGGERWLVRHGLAYLEACERRGIRDECFACVFWQVMRLRCLYYRHIVQRPLTSGLQWFVRYSEHISQLRGPLWNVRPEAAFRVAGRAAGQELRIMALETRIAGGATAAETAAELRAVLTSWQNVLEDYGPSDSPELGVLVHFLKGRDRQRLWTRGNPQAFAESTFAEPARLWEGDQKQRGDGGAERHDEDLKSDDVRFGEFIENRAENARAVAELLCAVPSTLWVLRGIDVANDELAVPTWVLVPLYRYVRQEAAFASVLPGAGRAPTLRTTAHVGEDFRHLMEGLRRIFETVHYLLAPNGSRLGHATALGFEPRWWAETVGGLLMPLEERLWDLVFEWRLYSGAEVPAEFMAEAPAGRLAYLTTQIRDLGRRLFREQGHNAACEAADLAELHHHLHEFMLGGSRPGLMPTDLSVARAIRRWGHRRADWELMRAYLCDRAVFREGQELIEVPFNEGEVAALHAIQDAVRRGVAARGIAVEVNPTSNLLIGDMLDLRNHPILRLFPIEPDKGPPPVPIAIGSDDPVTFNTSLLREYALLYHAGRSAGYSDRVVQDWLDRIRQTSMDARFSLPWRPDAGTKAGLLIEDLDCYLLNPGALAMRRARLAQAARARATASW